MNRTTKIVLNYLAAAFLALAAVLWAVDAVRFAVAAATGDTIELGRLDYVNLSIASVVVAGFIAVGVADYLRRARRHRLVRRCVIKLTASLEKFAADLAAAQVVAEHEAAGRAKAPAE